MIKSWMFKPMASGGDPWTPADITTVLWLDADAITGLNDGDDLTTWDDLSGNNNDAVGSTSKPTYETNELDGKAVVRFAGNDFMDHGFIETSPAFTYVILWKCADGAANKRVFISSTVNYPYLQFGSTWYVDNGSSTVALASDTWAIKCGMLNSTAGYRWTDGTANGTSVGYAAGNAAYHFQYLGLSGYGGIQGDVAEIIVCDSNLSTSDREKTEGYLAWKWGLEGNLPIGHTYKSSAPTK